MGLNALFQTQPLTGEEAFDVSGVGHSAGLTTHAIGRAGSPRWHHHYPGLAITSRPLHAASQKRWRAIQPRRFSLRRQKKSVASAAMTRRAPWLGGLDGCPENRKTLIRELHMVQVNDLKEQQIVDSIHVLEATMRHFFYRVLRGPSIGRKEAKIDEDYRHAGMFAGMLAPYKASVPRGDLRGW